MGAYNTPTVASPSRFSAFSSLPNSNPSISCSAFFSPALSSVIFLHFQLLLFSAASQLVTVVTPTIHESLIFGFPIAFSPTKTLIIYTTVRTGLVIKLYLF